MMILGKASGAGTRVAEADRTKPPKELNRRFIIVEGLYQNTGADP